MHQDDGGILIDDSGLEIIEELLVKYQQTYGKEADVTLVPHNISQQKVIRCLNLMISDNLSFPVAFGRLGLLYERN